MAGRPQKTSFAAARERMIREIEAHMVALGTAAGDALIAPKVLKALRQVPREQFLPDREQADAYADTPLSIGHQQTISQPLIVALMTHHLRLEAQHRVLEIGTGSGYQTAVLAEIAHQIVTIETISPLAKAAKATLDALGYRGIHFIEGDGRLGAPNRAPFDRIIVTAAGDKMPRPLIDQLAPLGRLIAPIGALDRQDMVLLEKSATGKLQHHKLFPVAFVPLT